MHKTRAAIVLAGGRSRRMGTDKALLRLEPTGPRLIELVIRQVAPLVGTVLISTNQPELYAWLGLPMVADHWPGCGPLAGLEAGLRVSQAHWNILLACDMPYLQPGVLAYLLDQTEPGLAAVVPRNLAGRPEPLCAVYNRAVWPVVREHLMVGRFKMTDWLADLNKVCWVEATALTRFDPELTSFDNLNSPEDLPGKPV